MYTITTWDFAMSEEFIAILSAVSSIMPSIHQDMATLHVLLSGLTLAQSGLICHGAIHVVYRVGVPYSQKFSRLKIFVGYGRPMKLRNFYPTKNLPMRSWYADMHARPRKFNLFLSRIRPICKIFNPRLYGIHCHTYTGIPISLKVASR